MVERFRLEVPTSLPAERYWSSCRAVLALATALGLQATTLLMIGVGPRAESPHDPTELTAVGRFLLTVEYDTPAYAAGCVLTVLLACLGSWAWNRHLLGVPTERADSAARRGARAQLGLAIASLTAFGALLAWLGPTLVDSRFVAGSTLAVLAAPGLAGLAIWVAGHAAAARGAGRPS